MSDITGNSSTNRAPARHSGTGGGVSGESDQAPTHHRLDLAGNRQVNSVLHLMQVPQIRSHPPARDYIDRERAEQEARRAHKRHLANVVIRRMWADHTRRHEAGAQLPAAAAA